ncbi:MAG: ATP-binding cassette domain-containing protein [Pseudomonadota bacterium]
MLTVDQLQTPLIGPISFVLDGGSCATVSGPSGAGKSLLLRALSDLDDSSGTISLGGKTKEAHTAPEWRRKVAYVPAESGWWTDNVQDHFQDTPNLAQLLDTVGLPDALAWQVSRLSTGERQRLALVRALQLNPQVLLLDEPTSALDPVSVSAIETLLKSRISSGDAILLVTHDQDQPVRMNAVNYHMASGKLTLQETTRAAQ